MNFTRDWSVYLNNSQSYCKKILLGNFSAEEGTEVIKPTVENESLHEISNDNRVIAVNFATTKISEEYNVQHCNIPKFTWTSPGGHAQSHLSYLDIQKMAFSIIDVQS
jgi:hypothetical protein